MKEINKREEVLLLWLCLTILFSPVPPSQWKRFKKIRGILNKMPILQGLYKKKLGVEIIAWADFKGPILCTYNWLGIGA